jgi:hypothetical protein
LKKLKDATKKKANKRALILTLKETTSDPEQVTSLQEDKFE